MRKECNGLRYIPSLGKLLKLLPESVGNKFCKSDTFCLDLTYHTKNPHQNCLHLEQDRPKLN